METSSVSAETRVEIILTSTDKEAITLKKGYIPFYYYGNINSDFSIPVELGANVKLNLNAQKKDTIYLQGNLSDYQIKKQGSFIVLTESKYQSNIQIAINKVKDTLVFNNGAIDVQFKQDAQKNYYLDFGGKKLTSKEQNFLTSTVNLDKTQISISKFITEPEEMCLLNPLEIDLQYNTANNLNSISSQPTKLFTESQIANVTNHMQLFSI